MSGHVVQIKNRRVYSFNIDPIRINRSPIRIRVRSKALFLRFFSRNNRAPNTKETITLLRLIIETIDIIELSEVKA